MKFFQTFRVRLLIILAVLLIATLGVQYYLNLQTEQQNALLREKQGQALVAGIALGVNSITSDNRLMDLAKPEAQFFFDERITSRIKDIIVITNEWKINDSLSIDYLPTESESGQIVKVNLRDIKDLPPLVDAYRLGDDRKEFPNAEIPDETSDSQAHVIPIETSDGRWYVMVLLKTDKSQTAWRAAQPLIYMLVVLLLSTLITIFLVWRFTRPLANISEAALKSPTIKSLLKTPFRK